MEENTPDPGKTTPVEYQLPPNEDRYASVLKTEFKEQFEEINYFNDPINIEKKLENTDTLPQERFIITASNIASISSIDNKFNIWDVDFNDKKLLNRVVGKILTRNINQKNDWGPCRKFLEYDNRNFQITYYPETIYNYDDIRKELTKRKEILQK
ncbi:MAG: hypothetical protein PHE21_00640 [Candidatus Dojkabacteria bacterium]|nr:hypothetical protein [Candidatus Dojkabacteria bacterium]